MRSENTANAKPKKVCQECNRQYPADGLIYCPFDGSTLVDMQKPHIQPNVQSNPINLESTGYSGHSSHTVQPTHSIPINPLASTFPRLSNLSSSSRSNPSDPSDPSAPSDPSDPSNPANPSNLSNSSNSFNSSPSSSRNPVVNPSTSTPSVGSYWTSPLSTADAEQSSDFIELGNIVAGRYEVLSHPTVGKTASIYRARHTLMNKEVALKVLLRHALQEQSTVARFQNEAKIVSGLAHPNIVTIHDFGITEEGLPYMLLNYIEGPTLADVLRTKKTIDVQLSLQIILQICQGLSYVHKHLKIHGAVMPRHIMLTPARGSYAATIIDFSQAQSLGVKQSVQPAWDLVSSPAPQDLHYLAPEQLKGGVLDDRTDIYAIGCVIVEMLTGSPPFTGSNGMEIRTKHLSQPPQTLSNLSRGVPKLLDQMISRCLQKDPDKRFQTVENLMRELISLDG